MCALGRLGSCQFRATENQMQLRERERKVLCNEAANWLYNVGGR
jgi:hypothetical protein